MRVHRVSHKDHDHRDVERFGALTGFDYGERGYAELGRAGRERQARLREAAAAKKQNTKTQ
jgi:hypothetical protein